jgi:hypothetical protein
LQKQLAAKDAELEKVRAEKGRIQNPEIETRNPERGNLNRNGSLEKRLFDPKRNSWNAAPDIRNIQHQKDNPET